MFPIQLRTDMSLNTKTAANGKCPAIKFSISEDEHSSFSTWLAKVSDDLGFTLRSQSTFGGVEGRIIFIRGCLVYYSDKASEVLAFCLTQLSQATHLSERAKNKKNAIRKKMCSFNSASVILFIKVEELWEKISSS